MKHGSLFSGIGGFDLAAEWMGWENAFHCEWNEFGQKILKHYWPNAESYGDITKTDFTKWRGTIDIVSGGFPCQPFSTSGERRGKDDDRHLWPEMLRAIREIAPSYIVGENVRGLVNWNGGMVFNEVHSDLENEGYSIAPFLIPASGVGAWHKRERVWFVAYANGIGLQKMGKGFGQKQKVSIKPSSIFDRYSPTQWDRQKRGSGILRDSDGLPTELDGITFPKWRDESVKAYGNAIVPQVAYEIFKAIERTNSIQ